MTSTPFVKLFGRSPVGPLKKHMVEVNNCVSILSSFFSSTFKSDWKMAEKQCDEIGQLEHKADLLKHDICTHLPRKFFMQIPRTDLLELISRQDAIANLAKDIAGLVMMRKIEIPKLVKKEFTALLNCSLAAVKKAKKAINELGGVLETGFSSNEICILDDIISEISEKEHEADELQNTIFQKLHVVENDFPVIDILFCYNLIQSISNLADRAQNVGDRLLIILAR
jgi:predicted phosphate transport protein (TIGR00153 family)